MDIYVIGGLAGLSLAIAGIVTAAVVAVRMNWGRPEAGEDL